MQMNLEQSYYYQKRQVLPYDQGFVKDVHEYCPPLMEGVEEDDIYSEPDSDNEEQLVIELED